MAHVVQMTSKIKLSGMVSEIKKNCKIILLRRRDKIRQFASWIYFHQSGGVLVDWHNHKPTQMYIKQQEIEISEFEIDQFLLEQMLDDFFQPDDIFYYEELDLSKSSIKKNQYAWDLPLIFSNLDFVESKLQNWIYHEDR